MRPLSRPVADRSTRSLHSVARRSAAGGAHDRAARMTAALTHDQIRAAVTRAMPGVRADLERLVRIPGIAFDGFDHEPLQRSAEAVAELLRGAGLPDVRIVRENGGHPAVIGRRPAPHGPPT